MKERLLKMGVTLLLVAVTVMAGVLSSYPVKSQAAGGTTYNVTLVNGSATLSLVSVNSGAAAPNTSSLAGESFQMVVASKVKTEKVKSTGGKASYYEVTIP